MLGSNAISAELADTRTTTAQEAKAGVDAIQAQLDLARLNLSFTRVTAPISGRVSRAEITAGNIVTADTTALTSVVSTDKVYAYFDADERLFLKYGQLSRQGQRGQTTPVYMGLSNEEGNNHLGQMNFVDNQVNPKTGTIRGRAVFDNADGQYTPGLYARLKLVGSAAYAGLLIKDEAVGTDLGKKFVLVIDQDNKAVYRSVDLGPKLEGLRIVRSGLQKDDRIVINGLQRVRPGAVVAPQDAPMADPETVATLTRQRQAVEAGNQPAAHLRFRQITGPGENGCAAQPSRIREHRHEILTVLYHAADLRRGAVAADPDRRRHLAVPVADQRIPRGGATHRCRPRQLSGRQPQGDRRNRGSTARTSHHRCREHAVHVLAVHGRRPTHTDRDLRLGHRSG